MKNFLKRILRRLACVPLLGRFIRIGAAVYRLPALTETVMRIGAQLERISQQPQPEASTRDPDLDNLVLSLPVVLRQLRRDLDRLETMVADLQRPSATAPAKADRPRIVRLPIGTEP